MSDYDIITDNLAGKINIPEEIHDLIKNFAKLCNPIEKHLYLHLDTLTNAVYCECHTKAQTLVKLGTINVALDPDEQPEYRANREIVEDHMAFEQMKTDAAGGRTFSNIVVEFDADNDPDHPLKIIGGQHRYLAVEEALNSGVNESHGIKVYLGLNKDQRLDVQLISNVNIAVSTDLYDRLQETSKGPELRKWSQEVGFLDPGQDFSAKRQRGSAITVREIRSFIVNFYLGKEVDINNFENSNTIPILCKTGKPDEDWDKLRKKTKIWTDKALKEAGREFVLLDEAQRNAISNRKGSISSKYAERALNLAILTSWSYVAGLLQNNKTRLERHYNLKNVSSKDPLNAEAMAKYRHKSDPENYRGLATRNDSKERGRCVEVFYLQAEKDTGITPAVIDAAIKRYHKKQAQIEATEAEEKI